MNTYSAAVPMASRGPLGWFRRAEAWLDAGGRKAWIFAMILGFVFIWPVGLAIVAYMTFTNRWSKDMFGSNGGCAARRNRSAMMSKAAWRSSGNTAFDAYKADTLRRLEEEQEAFESFLQRLREAKDKSEFDNFMDERARGARTGEVVSEGPQPGAY